MPFAEFNMEEVRCHVKKAADFDDLPKQIVDVNMTSSSFERWFSNAKEGSEANDSVILKREYSNVLQ